jgi:hypothetical protein
MEGDACVVRAQPPSQSAAIVFSPTPPPPPQPPPPTASSSARPSPETISIEERVRAAGGKPGDIEITLSWGNCDDLDLYVKPPGCSKIYFADKTNCMGELDVDMNVGDCERQPVEHVVWQRSKGPIPSGEYKVLVHNYNSRSGRARTNFTVTLKNGTRPLQTRNGTAVDGEGPQEVLTFTYP